MITLGGRAMPMEQVRRPHALSKTEFHSRLREWLNSTDDAIIGPEGLHGQTVWIYVHDGPNMFGLHADTKREAVDAYLRIVAQQGNDLQWEVAESQRGNPTAVVYGPNKHRHKPFYLYLYE